MQTGTLQYGHDLHTRTGHVIVVDSSRVRIAVRDGHLSIDNGTGQARRIARAPRTAWRIVILSPFGYITLEAGRWLSGARVPWSIHDRNGTITGTSGPGGIEAAMLRCQVAAPLTVRLGIVRGLTAAKLQGQARVLERRLGTCGAAATLRTLARDVTRSYSIDEIRGIEGQGASLYWETWGRTVTVPFSVADSRRVPAHWLRFNKRESYSTHYARNYDATDPVNAMLNFAYRIAETEAVHACHALGMHPRLGIMHADKIGRDSLALDLIEAVRPNVDMLVLDILSEIPFRRAWVHELRDGVVRLDPPITRILAERSVHIAKQLAPHAERVARALAGSAGLAQQGFTGPIPNPSRPARKRRRSVLE